MKPDSLEQQERVPEPRVQGQEAGRRQQPWLIGFSVCTCKGLLEVDEQGQCEADGGEYKFVINSVDGKSSCNAKTLSGKVRSISAEQGRGDFVYSGTSATRQMGENKSHRLGKLQSI